MDPIFWAVVITLLIRKVFVDGAYAVRGETPPSAKLKMAKLQAAGSAPVKPSRYGGGDYLRDLWHDTVEDAREARVQRRADARAAAEEARRPVPVGAPEPAPGTGGPPGPEPDPADQIPPVPCHGCGRPLRPHQVNRGDDGEARCRTCHWAAAPDPDDPRGQQGTGGQNTDGQKTDGQGTGGSGSSGGAAEPDPSRTGPPAPDRSATDQPGRPEPTETGTGPGQRQRGLDLVPCIGCGKPLDMNDKCDFTSVASLAKDARRRADGAPICRACSYRPAINCAGCGTEVLPWGVWPRASDGAEICGACHAQEIGDHGFCLRPDGCGPDCPRRRPAYAWTCRCRATDGPFDTEALR